MDCSYDLRELIDVVEGKIEAASKGKVKSALCDIGREICITSAICYDYANQDFDSKKACEDICEVYGEVIPLCICAVWIKEHPEEKLFTNEACRFAEHVCRCLEDRVDLFEYVDLSTIHPLYLGYLFFQLRNLKEFA